MWVSTGHNDCLLFLVCVCWCVCVHARVYVCGVCVCVSAHTHRYVYMQVSVYGGRGTKGLTQLSEKCHLPCFQTVYHWLRVHQLDYTGSSASPRNPPASVSLAQGFQVCTTSPGFICSLLTWGVRNQSLHTFRANISLWAERSVQPLPLFVVDSGSLKPGAKSAFPP